MKTFAVRPFALVCAISICAALTSRTAKSETLEISQLTCRQILALQTNDLVAVLAWMRILPPKEQDVGVMSPDRIDQAAAKVANYCEANHDYMLHESVQDLFQFP